MKSIFAIFVTLVLATFTNAQTTQPGCYPYPKTISVTGSAEMNIIPDEIYVQVNLQEYRKKGENKTELDKIKTAFLANCRAVGIPDSNISVASYEGYNLAYIWRRKKRDPDMFASIIYQVKFTDTKKIDDLVDRLDDEATRNFNITHTSHSKVVEYRKQLKIMAVKAAKEKAVYLSEAINEQLGQAITIVEPEEYVSSDVLRNTNSVYSNAAAKMEKYVDGDLGSGAIDYRKIKLRFEVKILYALK